MQRIVLQHREKADPWRRFEGSQDDTGCGCAPLAYDDGLPPLLAYPKEMRPHLATLLDDFRRNERDVAVVRFQGVRRRVATYGDIARLAGRFAALLEQRGIGLGDRVVLWAENSAEWIAAFMEVDAARGVGCSAGCVRESRILRHGCAPMWSRSWWWETRRCSGKLGSWSPTLAPEKRRKDGRLPGR